MKRERYIYIYTRRRGGGLKETLSAGLVYFSPVRAEQTTWHGKSHTRVPGRDPQSFASRIPPSTARTHALSMPFAQQLLGTRTAIAGGVLFMCDHSEGVKVATYAPCLSGSAHILHDPPLLLMLLLSLLPLSPHHTRVSEPPPPPRAHPPTSASQSPVDVRLPRAQHRLPVFLLALKLLSYLNVSFKYNFTPCPASLTDSHPHPPTSPLPPAQHGPRQN